MTTLTIIVPTTGRSTLVGTLSSIAPQLEPGDEVIVACNNDGNYGAASIDRCQEHARGDVVLFCDDDDVYLDGALSRIRAWADANPGKIGLFRRRFNTGEKQWRSESLHPGNIQRMCIVMPNVSGKMPTWTGYVYEADIARDAAARQDADIEFVDEVIGLARPFEASRLRRLRYRLNLRTRARSLLSASQVSRRL